MSTKKDRAGTKINGIFEWQIGDEKNSATEIYVDLQGSMIVITGFIADKSMHLRIDRNTPNEKQIFNGEGLRYVEYNFEFCSSAHSGTYQANLDILNKTYKLEAELNFFAFSEIFNITLNTKH